MVVKTAKSMTAKEFDDFVKTHCGRWSERSIQIVRQLVLEGQPLNEVAGQHQVSTNYANSLRWRFLNRVEDVELAQFTSKEAPHRAEIVLTKYSRAIKKLDDGGYTARQIVDYLKTQDLDVTEEQVEQLLRGN